MTYTNFSKHVRIGSLGLLLLISACTNLETEEVDSVVIDDAGGPATGDPTELLASTYNDLSAFTDQAGVYALYEHTSDEMIPPTRGTDWGDNGVWRQLHAHTWDPTHQYVVRAWNELNQRAYKCNQVLASNPSPEEAAEAKFLRGFFMWHVMDLFGKVPFREFGEGVDVNPRVYTRSEAFDLIVKDLEEAIPDLPSPAPSAINNKASKAAAYTLLARLYLNKAVYKATAAEGPYTFDNADMDKVIEYADEVASLGYALEPEYFVNFTTSASKEIIFTSPTGTPENRYRMTLHYNNNPDGWNGFATLADFYATFEPSDTRRGIEPDPDGSQYSGLGRGFLVGQQYKDDGSIIINARNSLPLAFTPEVPLSGASTEAGIRVIKYHPLDKGNYIFLRYADVYLMKVEGLFRKGDNAAALALINDLRDLRNASDLGSIDEQGILDERGRELYWEGLRRMDQIRFGTWTTTWQDKSTNEPFRVLFPIPQQALDSNPNLTQNKGYPGYVGD
jgi:starch-binding outer membrane protein, SusD/RagB family